MPHPLHGVLTTGSKNVSARHPVMVKLTPLEYEAGGGFFWTTRKPLGNRRGRESKGNFPSWTFSMEYPYFQ